MLLKDEAAAADNIVGGPEHSTLSNDAFPSREFEASYSRVSQWAKRHDKSVRMNYVAPDIGELEHELEFVGSWFKRVKGYKN